MPVLNVVVYFNFLLFRLAGCLSGCVRARSPALHRKSPHLNQFVSMSSLENFLLCSDRNYYFCIRIRLCFGLIVLGKSENIPALFGRDAIFSFSNDTSLLDICGMQSRLSWIRNRLHMHIWIIEKATCSVWISSYILFFCMMHKMWRWSGGLANAKENGWPVLLLGGASEARQDSLGAFQEWPQMDSVRWLQIKTTSLEALTDAVPHKRFS
jgi:hypothetical protein